MTDHLRPLLYNFNKPILFCPLIKLNYLGHGLYKPLTTLHCVNQNYRRRVNTNNEVGIADATLTVIYRDIFLKHLSESDHSVIA